MRNSLSLPVLFLAMVCLSSVDVKGQWQPDVRLTTDPGLSLTAYNNGRRIGANGNVLHVVWADDGDGNLEVYYKRSQDGGLTWESDKRATSNSADSQSPSIGVSGSSVHVAWQDNRDGNYEIYYKRSTDGGTGWFADYRLTNSPGNSKYPSISVTGSVVHAVWQDDRDSDEEIYYKRSTDGGSSWGPDTRLTSNPFPSQFPSVAVSGSVVHVVWTDLRDAGWEIYYKRSTDGGSSWGPDTRLTTSTGWALYPSVAVSGSVVHVVCQDDRHGTEEIYYKRSTDDGASWGVDTRLTNNSAWSLRPSIATSGSNAHIAWYDYRDGNAEIYYKRAPDGGINWGQDTRLTNNPSYSENPSVVVSGSALHVVWQDDRNGNYEIYYKRDPAGNVTAIQTATLELPEQFSLAQNYPNPFNPSTTIRYELPTAAVVSLKIYNAIGQLVATIVDDHKEAGTHQIEWRAGNIPSGMYFYRLEASRRVVVSAKDGSVNSGRVFVETKKMLVVR